MKPNLNVKRRLAAGLVAWLVANGTLPAAEPGHPPLVGTNEQGISLSIRCTNTVLKVGDEIPIEFIITNCGTNDYEYADRNYDHGGRMQEYVLAAKAESGEAVPDPRADYKGGRVGGLSTRGVLRPGQSFAKIIPLNRWALVKAPGRYTVTGIYLGNPFSSRPGEAVGSDPMPITVLPRTAEEMDAYISDLTNQIAAIPPSRFVTSTRMPENVLVTDSVVDPGLENLVMKLTYTCSPKIVPILLETMYEPASGGFWEAEALLFYLPRTDETRKAILETATRRGLASSTEYVRKQYDCTKEEMKRVIGRSLASDNPQAWAAGALAAQQYADDAFTSRLIAIAMDPDSKGRLQAIYALAVNRTDESVKALRSLLNDSNKRIRDTVEQAVRIAYTSRGNAQGRPLRPEDFDARLRDAK